MNTIRIAISLFIVVLIAVSAAGWVWNGSQPFPQAVAARIVLALSGLAGVVGLVVIWGSDSGRSSS